MQTTPDIGPTASPPAGAVPDAVPSPGRRHPARGAHARLLSILRGDKYMINAYPPAWPGGAGIAEARRPEDDAADPAGAGRRGAQ
jgi:hypothetical protein